MDDLAPTANDDYNRAMSPNGFSAESGNKNRSVIVIIILGAWFCVALVAGLAGWFENASAPVIAGTVWTLTALVLFCCWKIPPCRKWVLTVDPRWLVALHLTRFVGLYFLYLSRKGELPVGFALPAGVGDVAVACLAVLILALSSARKWKILVLWNTIGLPIFCLSS